MARKLKGKWLDEAQIKVIKGFGHRFRMTLRSGVIRNNVSETEDADYGYVYSPSFLIKEIEGVAEEMAERGMDVYVSVNETGVEVAGLYPGTWDGEFVSWSRENLEQPGAYDWAQEGEENAKAGGGRVAHGGQRAGGAAKRVSPLLRRGSRVGQPDSPGR